MNYDDDSSSSLERVYNSLSLSLGITRVFASSSTVASNHNL